MPRASLIIGAPGSLVGKSSVRDEEPTWGTNIAGAYARGGAAAPPVRRCREFRGAVSVEHAVMAFVGGAVVSLAVSWLLVSRLERVGERLGLSEALLGLLAALAADTPEITASVTAISRDQRTIGAGVVIGSNVFNLAALLGLGAVVAGRVGLHRKVVVLGGTVAMWVAIACLGSVAGVVGPLIGLLLVLVVLVPYVVVLGGHGRVSAGPGWPSPWSAWLASAINEEELELEEAVRPERQTKRCGCGRRCPGSRGGGQRRDGAGRIDARAALRGSRCRGRWARLGRGDQLPNAVAAVYLARARAEERLRSAPPLTPTPSTSPPDFCSPPPSSA